MLATYASHTLIWKEDLSGTSIAIFNCDAYQAIWKRPRCFRVWLFSPSFVDPFLPLFKGFRYLLKVRNTTCLLIYLWCLRRQSVIGPLDGFHAKHRASWLHAATFWTGPSWYRKWATSRGHWISWCRFCLVPESRCGSAGVYASHQRGITVQTGWNQSDNWTNVRKTLWM